jgi:hypothetical protein
MLPKLSAEVEVVVSAAAPVPVNASVSGLLAALVVTVIDVAGAAPTAVGENVTDIRQLLCAGRVVPHVVLDIA